MTDLQHPSPDPPLDHTSDRVDSWKEIARYLKRDESTVQRWEKREGMPVHRHLHDKRGSVYAFRTELDAWWQSRRPQLEQNRIGADDVASANERVDIRSKTPNRRYGWWIGIAATVALLLASVAVWKWLPLPWTSGALTTMPALVRLTSTTGLNIDPALSPDGSLLAYASDRGGSNDLDIWVQPATGEKPTQVTAEPGDEVEPSFSPDGTTIVFVKAETGGIYTVGAVGGEPRLLAAALRAHGPRFSPDGRFVTYWTGLPEWSIPDGPAGATGALFVVPTSGGAPRELAAGFDDNRHPIWSPDGEKILFLGESKRDPTQPAPDWHVVARGGGQPAPSGATEALRKAGVTGLPIPGAWTAGGVIFTIYDNGPSNVWQLAISPSTDRVTGTPRRLTFGTAMERSPSVSSAGRVAFTSVVENVDVWRVPLDPDTGLARGALERVTDNAAIDRMMNMSDDGRTMAFTSSRTGRNEVWIRDVQTGRERQITYSSADEGRVSRDGSLVAVRGGGSQDGFGLVPISGGAPLALCDNCRVNDWSPDGSRLLIRKDQTHLVMRERRLGTEIELTSHPTLPINQGRFSPDGRWVVFHVPDTPSGRKVYAVPTFGSRSVPFEDWTPIVSDFGMQASWSPDGSAVYHISLRDGAFCSWLQRLNVKMMQPDGPPVAVQHFHQPRLRAVARAASTNYVAGGYLYVTLTETAANIWMLDQPMTVQ